MLSVDLNSEISIISQLHSSTDFYGILSGFKTFVLKSGDIL